MAPPDLSGYSPSLSHPDPPSPTVHLYRSRRYARSAIGRAALGAVKRAPRRADALLWSATRSAKEKECTLSKNTSAIRIGQILVEQGVLSEQQVFEVLQAQKTKGLPFGVLAERLFEVSVESIEQAWIEQYSRFTGTLDLSKLSIDARALRLINRRQAWQFEILPVRLEPSGELLVAASRARLARAVTFVANRVKPVAYFRIAESVQLRDFLKQHYPMPEVSVELIRRAREFAQAS
jgi:hypothetical protein